MKNWILRAGALALALQMTAGTALGASVLHRSDLPLANSLALTAYFTDGDQTKKEHVLTYIPGGDVIPMVVYGDTLYGRSTMDYIQERYLADQGYTAVGAVNAAFFDMRNGLPIGILATDGTLRINGYGTAVGIAEDGTIRIGAPTLEVRGQWGREDILLHYNQLLTDNGIVLYSRDYDTKTRGQTEGYHVILHADTTTLSLDGTVSCTVKQIVEKTKSCPIPEDGFVLSLAETFDYEPFQKAIRSLNVGDTVNLSVSIDEDWQNMDYIVGGGDMLVQQGRPNRSFELDSAERKAARTALGVKANGEVVCCTVDRSTISGGMTLAELADRMVELGCETAVNLDGGGSTCLGVTQPGRANFVTVNEPSDGEQRPCANYLFFVRPTTQAGTAEHLFVYPYDQAVLSGGQLQLEARAADGSYMPTALPGGLSWSASSGSIVDGLLTAGREGTTVVTAYSGPLTGTVQVHVVETPSTMTILREDWERPVEQLLLECGTSLDLTASAQYLGLDLAARDRSFTWTVPEALGAVDRDGFYTAADTEQTGVLSVSCGDLTVEIPVETRINPMTDLEGHWARAFISQLYFRDVLKGNETADGTIIYRPDDSMTRQEFVVALVRWLGVDPADYADTDLPFADTDRISDWALNSVKAAYALEYFTGSGGSGSKVYANPGSTITREAAMTILARTRDALSDSDILEAFSDQKKVSDWARPALTAMVEQGVINGMDGKLQPQGNVTRAQVAKLLFAME